MGVQFLLAILLITVVSLFQNCGELKSSKSGRQIASIDVSTASSFKKTPPTLSNLFTEKARFQTIDEAQRLNISFGGASQAIWDQKLLLLHNSSDNLYYSFTRAKVPGAVPTKFQIVALVTGDGVNFSQYGEPLFGNMKAEWTLYDPHVSFDGQKYIMTMECSRRGRFGPSLCISHTKTPFILSSWTQPGLIIRSINKQSASTGLTFTYKGKTYLSWTLLDDGDTNFENDEKVLNEEDGDESTSSVVIRLHTNLDKNIIFHGNSSDVGKKVLEAKKDPYCTSSWDCNNLDLQDVKVQGEDIYAIYNGANYYRCKRPASDKEDHTSRWGLAIRRTKNPLGAYSETSGILIDSVNHTTCGISYPVINQINGQTYLYYAYYDRNGANKMARSKLIWGSPLTVTTQTKSSSHINSVTTRYDEYSDRVETLYVKLLDRFPSNEDKQKIVDDALTHGFKHTALQILGSPEHLRIWKRRNSIVKVRSLYAALLLRAPDPGGLEKYNRLINQGVSTKRIFDLFVNSKEFANKSPRLR